MPKDRLQELLAHGVQAETPADAAVVRIDFVDGTGAYSNAESPADGDGRRLRQREAALQEFFADVNDVRDAIERVESKVGLVKLKQSAVLASPAEDLDVKKELDDLMSSIKSDANRAKNKLKSLQSSAISDSDDECLADTRIRRTQCATISRKLAEVMNDYNKAQVDYRDACKSRIKRQLNLARIEKSDEELEEMLETGSSAIFAQGIMTDTQQARAMLSDIEARHGDIVQLERNITELHDMFMDMAMMIETQGELLDRIEFNVDKAKEYVESGQENLKSAVVNQKAARSKRIYLIIIGIVVAIVIAVCVLVYILISQQPR